MEPCADKLSIVMQALTEHRQALMSFVGARVAPADRDDVLQTAAMRAVERAHRLQHPERILAWLYRLHRNVIVDAARARAQRNRLVAPSVDAPDLAAFVSAESCRCSLHQMERLHLSYAAILALVELRGATLAEAATTLHISVNSATVRLHRARTALRKRMSQHCGVASTQECLDCRCNYEGCCA